jgi:hypothetical protein
MNSVTALPTMNTANSVSSVVEDLREQIVKHDVCVDHLISKMTAAINASDFVNFGALVAASSVLKSSDRTKVIDLFAKFVGGCLSEDQSDLALDVEHFLYSYFLKSLETEADYHQFYDKISQPYSKVENVSRMPSATASNGYLFVVHTPVMLAHINPLHRMLELNGEKNNREENVALVVLEGVLSEEFKSAFENIGVVVYSAGHIESRTQKILEIEKLRWTKQFRHVIWQCAPIFLSLAAQMITDLSWWSVKFHPGIKGLNKYIGSLGGTTDFCMNGNNWSHFVAPVKVNNLHKDSKIDWPLRSGKFGCFTREELIDNSEYWSMVSQILEKFSETEFHYAGRSSVHEKWVPKGNGLDSRINFLGWLKDPEVQLRNMSFLLDPIGLGHGNMAREAVAAGIPIVFPMTSNDTPVSTIQKLVFAYSERHMRLPEEVLEVSFLETDYRNVEQLFGKLERLLTDQTFNDQIGEKCKALLAHEMGKNPWDAFKKILNGV